MNRDDERLSVGPQHGEAHRLRADRDRLASILTEIGDAVSPTGERPAEALGTLAADVRALVDRLALVSELTHDTDGNDLDPDVDIPVGEVMRALAGRRP